MFQPPCTSVELFARLDVKKAFDFFRMIRRPRGPPTRCEVPGIYTAAVRTAAAVV